MPLPFPIRVLLAAYRYLAPYLGDNSRIKTWLVKNKILTVLILSLLIQFFIIVTAIDQLFESNKQIVARNEKIHELQTENEHIRDKNQVLNTVLDRLANGPLDELKSTEAVPLPEPQIKKPIVDPYAPKGPDGGDSSDEVTPYTRRPEDSPEGL